MTAGEFAVVFVYARPCFHFPAMPDWCCRVFVKTVVPYGPAGLDGRVQVRLTSHFF